MRTFADPSFFRLFHELVAEAHSDLRRTKWVHRGVNWTRERHSYSGTCSRFAIDQYLLRKPDPHGCSLLVIKEIWWDGDDNSLRSVQWAKPLADSRSKAMAWLKKEERRILETSRDKANSAVFHDDLSQKSSADFQHK